MPTWIEHTRTGDHTLRGVTHSAHAPKRDRGGRYAPWTWEVKSERFHKAYAYGEAPTRKEAKRIAAAVLKVIEGTP